MDSAKVVTSEIIVEEGEDVIQGLSQTSKTLPCRYLYDDRDSELFEQICDLPEYYPTLTEQAILEKYAQDIAQLTGQCELIDLGSGSSRKLAYCWMPIAKSTIPCITVRLM